MLQDEIKARMFQAMKAKRDVEKEILRVALGEITTELARGDADSDAVSMRVLKKLVKSNEESLALADDVQKVVLQEELRILAEFLPKTLDAAAIAEQLVISRKTVANHVEHIYTKIGVSNRAGAALFATRHGLLTPEETVPV